MKKRNSLICLAFLATAICACTQNEELESAIAPGYETTSVQLNLSTSGMNVLGALEADTRATDQKIVRANAKKKDAKKEEATLEEDASCMDVVMGASEGAETRATVPATDAEKKITNFTVFQFGTDNKLVYVKHIAGDGNGVDVDLAQTGANSKVYVVANAGDISGAYTVGTTTEAQFTASSFGKAATAGDLPMIGSATINMATATTLSVTLQFMVAKVVFTPTVTMASTLGSFTITSVKLKNVPTKLPITALTSTTNSLAVQDLNGNVSGATTWYVPENPAGTVAGILNTDRGDYKAPKTTAMYAEVIGDFKPAGATETSQATYQVYLGNGASTDFNVSRNTIYNVGAKIKGINVQDGRVLIGTDLSPLDATTKKTQTANCYIALAKNTYYRFDATKEGKGESVLLSEVLGTDVNKVDGVSVAGTDINVKAIVPTSAFLVWQTAATEGGTGNTIATVGLSKRNYVVFRTGSEAEGNAVIGVKDASTTAAGAVRWSWHIWKTASDPRTSFDEFKVRNNTTGLFTTVANVWNARTEKSMKRNLGAANNNPKDKLAGGLLYQWGRKDPFVGSADYASGSTTPLATVVPNTDYAWKDGSTHGSATSAINPNEDLKGATAEAYAIAHPTHFIIQYNSTTYDWYAATRATQNDNLWGNPNASSAPSSSVLANQKRGLKTKYDPCPYGWRVAPQDTWTSFTKSSDGRIGGNNFSGGTSDTGWKSWNVVGNEGAGAVDYGALKTSFDTDKGWTFFYEADGSGKTTYFPASGWRHIASGALNAIATFARCWQSSSLYATHIGGSSLLASTGNVNPLNYGYRSESFPVRCVQE